MAIEITVKTIGHYKRDDKLESFPGELPKSLNGNRKYFENPDPELTLPDVDLSIDVQDTGDIERKMESFLDYISKSKEVYRKVNPDFVTTRELLCDIASSKKGLVVHIIRNLDQIFLLKVEDKKSEPNAPVTNTGYSHGAIWEHFFTRKSDDEKIPNSNDKSFKAVLEATIQHEKEKFKVFYSGQIDAIDDEKNKRHYEIKINNKQLFWAVRSCRTYWQAYFGDVSTIVIGFKSKKWDPNEWKWIYNLDKIQALNRQDIPDRLEEEKNTFQEEKANANRNLSAPYRPDSIVWLKGFPFETTVGDIKKFLGNPRIVENGIYFPDQRRAKPKYVAYVCFENVESAEQAVLLDRKNIKINNKNPFIEVRKTTDSQLKLFAVENGLPAPKFGPSPLVSEPNAKFQMWTVDEGKNNIHSFLKEVKSKCDEEEECYVARRLEKMNEDGIQEWEFSIVEKNKKDDGNQEIFNFLELVRYSLRM